MIPPSRSTWWSGHEGLVQVIAVAALIVGAAYLTWRFGWSIRSANPLLFSALIAAEVFGWLSLGFYAFLAWSVPSTRRPLPLPRSSVDVFVCTYDEPVEVVEATLVGCRAITTPHTTHLLDDGRRPRMAELASRLGARYVTRADNAHAKAGNINHALKVTDSELILVLDADHIPMPDILEATTGYFADPKVALVQTPHDFSNRDSAQHTKTARHEQTLFYSVIAPGKDRHNAMFWCGSATLLRRTALLDVGGVLTDTVAEDFHTTIAMHARGWRTRYHEETLVQGLAPHDLAGFLLQRARWARGNIAVFRTRENPLTCRRLSFGQRVSYFASLFNYFSGLQRLILLAVLIATLLSGELPLHASVLALIALWLPWSVLAFVATIALGRGTLGPLDSSRYGLLTMGIYLRGIAALLRRGAGQFKVTPKYGVDQGGVRIVGMVRLLTTIGVTLALACLLRVLDVAGVVDLPSLPGFATGVVIALGVWELYCIANAVVPMVRRRQLRVRFRTPLLMSARIAGTTIRVQLHDLTPEGLGFESAGPYAVGTRFDLLTRIPDVGSVLDDITLPVEVQSCTPPSDAATHRVGCRIVELDQVTRHRLVEYCDVVLATQRLAGSRAPAGLSTRPATVDVPAPVSGSAAS